MLSSSDLHHGQGLWLTQVRYQIQEGLFHPLGLTACSSAMVQILFSEVKNPRKLPVYWKVWPALLEQREMPISPSLQLLSPFLLSLSSFIPPSFLPSSSSLPSPDFLTLVTKRHPVTTCLMLYQRCRYDDTVGSFTVVCDINIMAQART